MTPTRLRAFHETDLSVVVKGRIVGRTVSATAPNLVNLKRSRLTGCVSTKQDEEVVVVEGLPR